MHQKILGLLLIATNTNAVRLNTLAEGEMMGGQQYFGALQGYGGYGQSAYGQSAYGQSAYGQSA